MLEGLDDRALALDGSNLQILRWGSEQERVPLERRAEAEAFAAAVDAARESG